MSDIIKEVLKIVPAEKIADSAFEGANIVLYTNDKEFFLDHQSIIRQAVSEFKKRIEVRPHPSLCLEPEKAEKRIRELIPEEAGIQECLFDPPRAMVIINAEKPGIVIGKQGEILRAIREQTFWVPLIKRIPPLRSKLIEGIRSVLFDHAEDRKKFLDKTGHRVYDGWLREKKHEWVRVSFLGAARQVGRSCLLLQTPESRILLDCGIDPSQEGPESYPFLDAPEFNISEIDAVIVSHAHLDHTGLIPYLLKYGYQGPIYCTEPTRDVMALLQLDFIKIQRNEGEDPIYTTEDVRSMVLHTICIDYDAVTDITPDMRLTFYNAGHMLGSAIVHLNIGNGLHNLVYTGDIKYARTNLLEAAHTQFPRVETLIMEATYGGRDNVMNSREADDYMTEVVTNTFKRGGKVLMPVLGSGRAQEVMVLLESFIRNGQLDKVPIVVDGMVWDITAIHTAYPEFLNSVVRKLIFHKDQNPFLSEVFREIGSQKERMQVIEEMGPCVILATSGMLMGGPSVEYLRHLADNPNNCLLFVAYQGEGSLGRKIQRGNKEIMFGTAMRPEICPVRMEVVTIEGYSGHSGRKELMTFMLKCNPKPKKVIVNHGENSRCLDLASSIHKLYRIETVAPRNLETVRIK